MKTLIGIVLSLGFLLPLSPAALAQTEATSTDSGADLEAIAEEIEAAQGAPAADGATEATEFTLPQQIFFRAKILGVEKEATSDVQTTVTYNLEAKSGDRKGETFPLEVVIPIGSDTERFGAGDSVIIVQTEGVDGPVNYLVDHYRLPALGIIFLLFALLAIFVARKRAAFALVGMVLSIIVIAFFIVPKIAAGQSPLLIGLAGAGLISVISLYVAHGFSRRTTVALVAMLVTILAAVGLASLAVDFAHLIGIGSEEAYYVQLNFGDLVDLRGLLLVGIVIGALGVLDDIATSLVATVEEIHDANPKLTAAELYKKGNRVGREHIASLINTLVLAYAGASMPLLLLLSLDPQPFWVTLNSQFLGEEILRTIIGSAALVLAVPVTTALAARAYVGRPPTHTPATPHATAPADRPAAAKSAE